MSERPAADRPPFSTQVREHTAAWHSAAEDSGFLRRVATGEATRDDCVAMTIQHRAVYRRLDAEAAGWASHPRVAPFVAHHGLPRSPALDADAAYLLGGPVDETLLPATSAYVARIAGAAATAPGLVAHHYTRYLGDLSGGLVIGRGFAGCLGIELGAAGTAFYCFEQIDDPAAFKDAYRRALDRVPWTEAERRTFLDEVVTAYELNRRMYDELAELGRSRNLVR